MKLSTAWLNDWLCRTMSEQDIVHALERAGLEVEQFIASKPIDKKVLVALVKEVVQHPRADRLKLVTVENGKGEVRVVCGAPNVKTGMKVALAQVSTVLPNGDVIGAAKLRGELSEGMLCSEQELGLGEDHNGIMEMSSNLVVGTPLCDIYPADGIVDLKTHANRFDLLSVVGLAREVAAMHDVAMKPLPLPITASGQAVDMLAKSPAQTNRFMLVKLRVTNLGPSPDWMTARLRAAGVRVISPLVDVTNYVNLELGQPLHAYDASKITLPLAVRFARAGERLVTLDGLDRTLTEADLVVLDARGPVGLAGLMGGAASEVDDATTEIYLEAATFDAVTVRKMGKRQGLRTEASARFERGLPVELPPLALGRAVELLQAMGSVDVEAVSDQVFAKQQLRQISLPMELLNRLMGITLEPKEAAEALRRLQLDATANHGAVSVAAVPWWRPDIKEAQDLVEEVVRVIGHERIPSTLPQWAPQAIRFDRLRPRQRLLQRVLYGAGLFEVMTYSFVSEEQLQQLGMEPSRHLKLKNPMSVEQAYLRSSLLASHLNVLARNRTYAKEFGFYELSKVFVKRGKAEQPEEPTHLAVTLVRPEQAYQHVKGIMDLVARELGVELVVRPKPGLAGYAPQRGAEILLDKAVVGCIGLLDPALLRQTKVAGEVAHLDVQADVLLAAAASRQFAGVSRFPHTERDVAVLVPVATTWLDVAAALGSLPNTAVSFVNDYYGNELPAGCKSLAVRLTISHPDRTPTDDEAAELEQKALAVLKRKFDARLRT